MRKFITACFAVFLVSSAAATTVHEENLYIDLASSEVEVEMKISDLTSNRFSYLVNYPIEDVAVEINGERENCEVTKLQIGSEINCPPPEEEVFNVSMRFTASDITDTRSDLSMMEYTQNFYRPTERFSMQVSLPRGAGLLDEENVSTSVISPSGYEIESDGKRIFVEWNDIEPGLGDTTNFRIAYENFSAPIDLQQGVALGVVAGLIALAGYFSYRRFNLEDIETVYGELDDDEIDVLELLRENGGGMLQKDVVESLDYSKAKVSGIVSGLVEKEVLVKEKEGRSNSLSISSGYRG